MQFFCVFLFFNDNFFFVQSCLVRPDECSILYLFFRNFTESFSNQSRSILESFSRDNIEKLCVYLNR